MPLQTQPQQPDTMGNASKKDYELQKYQTKFIEFCLAQDALKFGKFTLKSGRKSPYFFNTGAFRTGAAMQKLGEAYADAIVASKIE